MEQDINLGKSPREVVVELSKHKRISKVSIILDLDKRRMILFIQLTLWNRLRSSLSSDFRNKLLNEYTELLDSITPKELETRVAITLCD